MRSTRRGAETDRSRSGLCGIGHFRVRCAALYATGRCAYSSVHTSLKYWPLTHYRARHDRPAARSQRSIAISTKTSASGVGTKTPGPARTSTLPNRQRIVASPSDGHPPAGVAGARALAIGWHSQASNQHSSGRRRAVRDPVARLLPHGCQRAVKGFRDTHPLRDGPRGFHIADPGAQRDEAAPVALTPCSGAARLHGVMHEQWSRGRSQQTVRGARGTGPQLASERTQERRRHRCRRQAPIQVELRAAVPPEVPPWQESKQSTMRPRVTPGGGLDALRRAAGILARNQELDRRRVPLAGKIVRRAAPAKHQAAHTRAGEALAQADCTRRAPVGFGILGTRHRFRWWHMRPRMGRNGHSSAHGAHRLSR